MIPSATVLAAALRAATVMIAVTAAVLPGVLATEAVAAPPGDDNAQRIEFPPGTDSATVQGVFTEGQSDTYVLWAEAGQTMILHFEPAGAAIGVYAPDGTQLLNEPGVDFSVDLPATGDYLIVVGGGMGDISSSYTFTVRIPAGTGTTEPGNAQRIEFAPGTDYGSVAGAVEAGATDRYVLRAAAGQTMTVVTASVEQNAVVSVFDPNGAAMQPTNVPVFVGELPQTGDYVIEVRSGVTGQASTYGLAVHIPGPVPSSTTSPTTTEAQPPQGTSERIEFAPGTNTATVNGAVVLGTTNEYILRASAGQTMAVQIDSIEDNGFFDIYAPDGTALSVSQMEDTVQLPVDGDYVVVVSSIEGNATYAISFWVV